MTEEINAQPPEKLTGIKLVKVPETSVGIKAIKSALTQIKDEVGVVKGPVQTQFGYHLLEVTSRS